jgi:hypothetical protein
MFRILLAAFLIAGTGFANAEPIFPAGLRVGLEPAGDLKAGPGISGFKDVDRNATVGIAELPAAAYGELVKAMFGQAPASATSVERELFAFQNGIGYLHEAHTVDNGVAVKRWLFLTMPAGLKQSFVAVINVSVPETASRVYSDGAIRKMLASVTVRDPPIEEQLGLIPFKLEDLAGFRVKRVTPDSVFITDAEDNDDLAQRPYMVVTIGRAQPSQMDDRGRFSRDLLAQIPVRELTLQSAEQMRISGATGFEIRGRAEDLHKNKVAVIQWVRFLGGGFIRIVGIAPTEKWDEMFGRFRAVRDGVTMR